jgi:hypothetical protein
MRRVGLIDITVGNHGWQRGAPRRIATLHHATLRVAPHRYATREPLGTPGGSRAFSADGHPQAPVAPRRSCAARTFFVAQSWAECITNMPGFNLRQAQGSVAGSTYHNTVRPHSGPRRQDAGRGLFSAGKRGEIGGVIEPRSTLAKPPFFPEIGTTSVSQLGYILFC